MSSRFDFVKQYDEELYEQCYGAERNKNDLPSISLGPVRVALLHVLNQLVSDNSISYYSSIESKIFSKIKYLEDRCAIPEDIIQHMHNARITCNACFHPEKATSKVSKEQAINAIDSLYAIVNWHIESNQQVEETNNAGADIVFSPPNNTISKPIIEQPKEAVKEIVKIEEPIANEITKSNKQEEPEDLTNRSAIRAAKLAKRKEVKSGKQSKTAKKLAEVEQRKAEKRRIAEQAKLEAEEKVKIKAERKVQKEQEAIKKDENSKIKQENVQNKSKVRLESHITIDYAYANAIEKASIEHEQLVRLYSTYNEQKLTKKNILEVMVIIESINKDRAFEIFKNTNNRSSNNAELLQQGVIYFNNKEGHIIDNIIILVHSFELFQHLNLDQQYEAILKITKLMLKSCIGPVMTCRQASWALNMDKNYFVLEKVKWYVDKNDDLYNELKNIHFNLMHNTYDSKELYDICKQVFTIKDSIFETYYRVVQIMQSYNGI